MNDTAQLQLRMNFLLYRAFCCMFIIAHSHSNIFFSIALSFFSRNIKSLRRLSVMASTSESLVTGY